MMHARRRCLPFFAIVCAAVLAAGCSSSRDAADGGGADVPRDGFVHVLVDGADKGVLPATLQIRRSFGTRMVSLWRSGEEIRTFELLRSPTADDVQLAYSYWAGAEGDEVVYDVSVLPKDHENAFFIPFSRGRIRVEDRQYDLVLIVDE